MTEEEIKGRCGRKRFQISYQSNRNQSLGLTRMLFAFTTSNVSGCKTSHEYVQVE